MSVLAAVAIVTLATAGDKGSGVSVDTVTVNGQTSALPPPPPPPPPASRSGESNTVSNTAPSGPVAGQLWSIVAPRTVGQGGNLLEAGGGFPGIYAQYTRGILPTLDIGVRATVNYGVEGMVNLVQPELKLQAVVKYRIMDNGKISLGANFAPGPLGYFPRYANIAGFTLPLGLNLGIVASSALNVGVTFEVPFWVRFGPQSTAVIPVMTGAGVEYFISSSLAAWFALRMGPSIFTDGEQAQFTFDARLGIGWRF
jgi:hypothetical protein